MKSLILPLAVAALTFSSCVSSYKTGQTPDDVYYSPTRGADEYVQSEKKNDDKRYEGTDEYYEERYLHMRAQNRYRWSVLDDYYYNTPYAYNYYGTSLYNPYNSYWCWNNYYNPYYYDPHSTGIIIKNPKTFIAPPSRPIAFNPNSYSSGGTSKPTSRYVSSYGNSNSGGSRYNNSNGSSRGLSNSLQKVFSSSSSSNSSYNGSSSTPSRSYSPSSSSSSSSSGSSSRSSGSSSSSSGSSRPNR